MIIVTDRAISVFLRQCWVMTCVFVCSLATQQISHQCNSRYYPWLESLRGLAVLCVCRRTSVLTKEVQWRSPAHYGDMKWSSGLECKEIKGGGKTAHYTPEHRWEKLKCWDTKLKWHLSLDWLLKQTGVCHKPVTDVVFKSIRFWGILHFKWMMLCKWLADLAWIQEEREDNPLCLFFALSPFVYTKLCLQRRDKRV